MFEPQSIQSYTHNNVKLYNLTLAIKSYCSNPKLKPKNFRPHRETDMSTQIHNHKYVDREWMFNFLSDNRCKVKNQFVSWIFNQMNADSHVTPNRTDTSGKIDIGTTLGIQCSNCKTSAVQKIESLRTRKAIQDLVESTHKRRTVSNYIETIQQLLQQSNQNLSELLSYYYRKNTDEFEILTRKYLEFDDQIQKKSARYLNLLKMLKEWDEFNCDKYSLLYLKDHLMLSDDLLEDIRRFCNLTIIPSESTIKRTREEINTAVGKRYDIKPLVDGGWRTDLRYIIADVVRIHRNVTQSTSTCVEGKLCFDAGAKAYVSFTFTPLNLSTFASQSRDSSIVFAGYDGEEKTEVLIRRFQTVFSHINQDLRDQFEVDGQKYSIRLFLVNDLKALHAISDLNQDNMFCPFCKCSKHSRHLFEVPQESRSLVLKFPVQVVIIICILHLKIRVVSNILLLKVKSSNDETADLIKDRIKNLKGCSQFQYRVAASQEDDDDFDQVNIQLPYLNGKQADQILMNFETVLQGIADPAELMIWRLVRMIMYKYVQSTTRDYQQDFSLQDFKEYVKWLGRLLNWRYPMNKFAYYMHILIVHVPDLIEQYGSLCRFSNEGTEGVHSLHAKAGTRATSCGGSTGKEHTRSDPFTQTFNLGLRKIYLPSHYNIQWLGKKSLYDDTQINGVNGEFQETSLQRSRISMIPGWTTLVDVDMFCLRVFGIQNYFANIIDQFPSTVQSTIFSLSENVDSSQTNNDSGHINLRITESRMSNSFINRVHGLFGVAQSSTVNPPIDEMEL